jgi:hypothetical protein
MRRLLTHDESYTNNGRIENPYRSEGFRISMNDLPPFRLLQKWRMNNSELEFPPRHLPGGI